MMGEGDGVMDDADALSVVRSNEILSCFEDKLYSSPNSICSMTREVLDHYLVWSLSIRRSFFQRSSQCLSPKPVTSNNVPVIFSLIGRLR
jgi:hypothetical protein